MSRYLLLLTEPDHFAKWDAAGDAGQERAFAAFRAFHAAVRERGAIVGGEALAHPATARTVRPGDDPATRPVTEGPYVETVEQLGGFYLVEAPDLATAVDLAALLPAEYDVEVRACLDAGVPDA
ncbi:YciI family protein [Nocardioides marinquilinus]|uniref:YciI family protein n=1 Tax=Nocardioides marinquilinus TaxID=1210400 RepID=A0ABP9P9C1_9ACTN